MNDTETRSVSELEELLDNEIPCVGVRNRHCKRQCSHAASLKKHGHGCSDNTPYAFKCIACWQSLYSHLATCLARRGYIRCSDCDKRFYTVESFSDFRPF